MSAYTDVVEETEGGPIFWNRLSGTTTYPNLGSGGSAGDLIKNGTVQQNQASLLPGDTSGASIAQAKDSPAATRANNGLLDNPGAQPLTSLVWFRAATTKLSMPLFAKASQYTLALEQDGMLRSVIQGQTDDLYWTSPERESARVWPDGIAHCAVLRWDPAGVLGRREWRTMIDGTPAARRTLPSGQTIPTSSSDFQLGGQTAFGSQGFWGGLQEYACWYRAVPDDRIWLLVRLGMAEQEERYGVLMDAFGFSRVVADPGEPGRLVQNLSDEPVTVMEGASAFVGGGWLVPPGQQREILSEDYLSVIHDGTGPKRIRIKS